MSFHVPKREDDSFFQIASTAPVHLPELVSALFRGDLEAARRIRASQERDKALAFERAVRDAAGRTS